MGNVLSLIIIIPLIVVVVGLVMRVVPLRIGDIRFRDTDKDHAATIALSYAEGTYENRLGYPTGFYVYDEKSSRMPDRIVLKEAQPMGTVTDGCAVGAASMGAIGFEDGCGAGCVTTIFATIIAMPFVIVSFLDRMYRAALRSKVTFELRSDGADTVATLSLAGAGAYLMKSRYEKVFNLPELPESVRPEVPEPNEESTEPGETAT